VKCDVVVVGAGPAGSTAATFLAKKGLKVVLIDKEKFPRDKPCGGGIPISTFKRFPYLKDSDFIESYSYGGFFHSPSLKYKIEFHSEKPIVAMVKRDRFDHGLALIAVDNGTQFLDGKKVTDVNIKTDKTEVTLDDKTKISSEVLIGADGMTSLIARKSGLLTQDRKVNVCAFQEFKLNEKTLDEYATKERVGHIHLMYKNIPGYAWLFPKKDSFNIGVGEFMPFRKYAPEKVDLIKAFNSYFQFIKEEKLIPKSLKIGKLKGGSIPIYPLKKTYADRLLLCGDAAGFINPMSGGGIHFAMVSGENAATVIGDAFKHEKFKSPFLSQYQQMWMEEFGKDLKTFARFVNIWLRHAEKLIKIASKNHRLTDIAAKVLFGDIRIRDYRGKIMAYYIQDRIKDALGLI
jgi:geranylgeranyl reductase family protein